MEPKSHYHLSSSVFAILINFILNVLQHYVVIQTVMLATTRSVGHTC